MRAELKEIAQSISTSVVTEWVDGVPIIRANELHRSAIGKLYVLAIECPSDALDIIFELATHLDNEDTLDELTMGPLETLLRHVGLSLEPVINDYSSKSAVFRSMIEGASSNL